MGKDTNDIRQQIEETRDRVGDTVDALAYKADVPNRVKEAVRRAVTGGVTSMRSSMNGVYDSVNHTLRDPTELRSKTKEAVATVRRNPAALIVGGTLVGFLLGLMLPGRRQHENGRASMMPPEYPASKE